MKHCLYHSQQIKSQNYSVRYTNTSSLKKKTENKNECTVRSMFCLVGIVCIRGDYDRFLGFAQTKKLMTGTTFAS